MSVGIRKSSGFSEGLRRSEKAQASAAGGEECEGVAEVEKRAWAKGIPSQRPLLRERCVLPGLSSDQCTTSGRAGQWEVGTRRLWGTRQDNGLDSN